MLAPVLAAAQDAATEITELKTAVSEQSADLAKLARILGSRQDQLEGMVRAITGDVKSLRGRGNDASSLCGQFTSCGDCVSSPICGWCSVEQACVAGDRHGSLNGACQFYDFATCSGLSCSQYATCQECVSDPTCGFCAAESLCLEGNEFGPQYNAKCARKEGVPTWKHQHSSSQCGLVPAFGTSTAQDELAMQKVTPAPVAVAPVAPVTTPLPTTLPPTASPTTLGATTFAPTTPAVATAPPTTLAPTTLAPAAAAVPAEAEATAEAVPAEEPAPPTALALGGPVEEARTPVGGGLVRRVLAMANLG